MSYIKNLKILILENYNNNNYIKIYDRMKINIFRIINIF